MARPSKLTPELQEAICALIEVGDAPEVAAGVNGVGRSTFFEWQSRNEDFRTAVAHARDRFESNARAIVLGGDEVGVGFGPAKACLEVLSRRIPNRWSQRIKHEIDESNRLMLETLKRGCADATVYARVCEEGDLSAVLISVCTELARLDSEGDAEAGAAGDGAEATTH
jgi:hypothetical protein